MFSINKFDKDNTPVLRNIYGWVTEDVIFICADDNSAITAIEQDEFTVFTQSDVDGSVEDMTIIEWMTRLNMADEKILAVFTSRQQFWQYITISYSANL